MISPPRPRFRTLLAGALVLALAACGDSGTQQPQLPDDARLEGLYGDRATARLNGNVVDVRARQDVRQLERGGTLWARVGPYIYLFSPQTQQIFQDYPGVAAVRVRTVTSGGSWVAEATLRRDELNALTWDDARRQVARARKEGTQKPGYLEDLVDYGEDRTEYRYNEAYVESAG